MNALRWLVLPLFVAELACGQSAPQRSASDTSQSAEAIVQRLYKLVLKHRPIGAMEPSERKIFAPFLDDRLSRKLDSTVSCEKDYFYQQRGYKGPPVKAPFAWGENGTFSGGDDENALRSFEVEKSESGATGFIEVTVRLKWGDTTQDEKPWISWVVVVMKQEKDHIAVDDVIYLGEKEAPRHERLSEILSHGCRDGHWIGSKQ
jgi:hypothetical protein